MVELEVANRLVWDLFQVIIPVVLAALAVFTAFEGSLWENSRRIGPIIAVWTVVLVIIGLLSILSVSSGIFVGFAVIPNTPLDVKSAARLHAILFPLSLIIFALGFLLIGLLAGDKEKI